MPLRDGDGDSVGLVVPYQAAAPAVPLVGDAGGGPIRTGDGDLVGRVALYQVAGGVAVPVTSLGGSVGSDLTAEPPLQVTPSGDQATVSVQPGADGQALVTSGGAVAWGSQTADAVGAVPAAEKGVASGVASLGADGKVPSSQLAVTGGFSYLGSWDASTNTPTLANGTGTNGDMYKVSVAGTQDLGAGSIAFEAGDHVVYTAGADNRWERFTASEAVSSVAGKTGAVTLVKADVGLDQVDNTADADKPVSTAVQSALDTKLTTPTLTTKVVLGTTLSTSTLGLVGYDQDVLGDTLVMRQFGGQVSTAAPQADTDAATKAYVDTAVSGAGGVRAPETHTGGQDVTLSPSSAPVQLVDASSASSDVVVNLPDATDSTPAGTTFTVKKVDSSAHGLSIDGGEGSVDGQASAGITAQYGYLTAVFDGTNWQVIGRG